ncbi:putative P-loop containing nucleoside triphosphate hydrolase, leucine-rich repeat domain, L [Rosa chinensis]|uniref:Putative P-loop containing nucleoside triphosphate hydrolase, leucine-rich repeat domain, L n=1 Tax=Rosa chinensis TaxID=74649 RepID=A0A2P6PFR2_ROSCH|nr:putative disease resistance protein RGA3 [Rosa chinensis]XP_040366135.1 putative disease resistance protein RGA3 [Rosa chinensis]XP_040366136.1 putative disease resistance protein RGA3 [Rosa chinensis]XP_040366137.1 putative disease resistance protein RGA3 [Rosa chinensis]XP_040366138.1 putative disease resistance protein RGA3 [Rosa chinensis]XP_040366139.1 putative disease resistance protein RGA3 [Rosa chinensis]XP_040366140.1 putative disease resistance protein RGA3 [Rosa chinensis]PRQ2
MAEALVNLLVEKLGSVVYHHTSEGVKLVLKAKKEVDKFRSTLKLIQNVLHDAEKKQVEDPAVRDWLDQLKDLTYKMDDVLDAWNTEIGKREAEKQETQGSDVEVRFSFRSNCFCLARLNEVTRRYKIGSAIKDLNEELTQIYIDKNKYSLQPTMHAAAVNAEQPNPRSLTSSLVDISTIFGRQVEKERLVSELLREGRPGLVIPIVGMGGLGKTTVAQLVFNDARVQAHFDIKAWVCVSDPFDVIKIAKAIFRQLGGTQVTSDELQTILAGIQNLVKGQEDEKEEKKDEKEKKILLVLDDVWTEDHREWDSLKLPVLMQSCAEGSRIVVTTRKQEVARIMRATSDMINLERLSHLDSLKLFNSIAFLDREEDKSNKWYGDIAEKIVRKCDGLPLALKTLGSLLLHRQTIREWEEVLNSEIWNVKVVQEEVFRPLLLSYYDLAMEVKSCLLYCATYPKGFEFGKEILIEQWMSQGYLNVGENEEEATKGREVFTKLAMLCFLQVFRQDALTKEIRGCKMHDTVHDFIQYLNQNECLTVEATGTHGTETSSANHRVRHLTLMSAPEGPIPSLISKLANSKILRTLATFDSRITAIDSDLISQLKRLRSLNLSRNNIHQLPEEIGDLIHLRYLDLSRNGNLRRLPDNVCNLYNLQTLRLAYCLSLEKLPDNMGKLINLKHLHVKDCGRLQCLPKGIGSIRNLRTVDGRPSVYCNDDAEAFKFGDLRMMNQLRRLDIRISRVGENAASEAEKAELNQKVHLSYLRLIVWNLSGNDADAAVMNALRPHENLDSLAIWLYHGPTWPNWMTTSYLTRLTVFHLCYRHSSVLPPLGKLPSLKVVKLHWVLDLEEIGAEFYGVEEETSSFPSLETLYLGGLPSLAKWELGGKAESSSNSQMKSISIMPRLSSLHVVECPKLKQLPDFLLQNARLQNLLIKYCQSLPASLPDEFISRIPNVTIEYSGVDPLFKGRKIDTVKY